VFFSMAIILLAFIPVFALTGQEGKLFHPLAFTKTLAVLAATVIAVTLVPVLCTLLLAGTFHDESANPVMRVFRRAYRPVLETALSHRAATVLIAGLLFTGALVVGRGIGNEFMPPLDEGDLMFMPIANPSISLEQNTEIARRQNAALMRSPEVEYVVAKVARADTSTDPSPLNMTETIVHLKPRDQWRPGMTPDRLRAEMGEAAQLPGVANIWTMPIVNRIDMLTTGIRSELGVKIFGEDLATLDALAREVAAAVQTVPGAANVYAEPVTSGQYLNIEVDRQAAARYGIDVAAVQRVVETAVGETVLDLTIEGRRRFPVRVRYGADFRDDAGALRDVLVATPSGRQIPLSEVAHLRPSRGPAMISSENGLLVATVLLNVQDRDVGGFVEEARAAVLRSVALPPGYFVGWSGRYENQARAQARLQVVLPIVLVVIYILLYLTYRSFVEAAHVLLAVPFALTGGVYLIWLLDYNFSVAVWVGFIALFGTAVQTGVVMVIYLEEAVARKRAELGDAFSRKALREAVIEGALLRLRPKLMTVSTVVAGLLPIMWSTQSGAEVMKPLAAPVLGGMVSSLLHVLVVTPVLFLWIHERRLRLAPQGEPAGTVEEVPAMSDPVSRRTWMVVAALALVGAVGLAGWLLRPGNSRAEPGGDLVQTIRAGDLVIDVSAPDGSLRSGASEFTLAFRSEATGDPVDAGTVRVAAVMSMPGMVMSGDVSVRPAGGPGRYRATGQFGMAGGWQMTIEWDGPVGQGSAAFTGAVQ
jgi:Cu(I)/Ag(I) efflux system membrane protein CusA/SilA